MQLNNWLPLTFMALNFKFYTDACNNLFERMQTPQNALSSMLELVVSWRSYRSCREHIFAMCQFGPPRSVVGHFRTPTLSSFCTVAKNTLFIIWTSLKHSSIAVLLCASELTFAKQRKRGECAGRVWCHGRACGLLLIPSFTFSSFGLVLQIQWLVLNNGLI